MCLKLFFALEEDRRVADLVKEAEEGMDTGAEAGGVVEEGASGVGSSEDNGDTEATATDQSGTPLYIQVDIVV